jgi:hypothetical protein
MESGTSFLQDNLQESTFGVLVSDLEDSEDKGGLSGVFPSKP